jgi:hypothetical protein
MSPSHLKTETGPVSETLCSVGVRIPDDGKVQEPSNSMRITYISFHKSIEFNFNHITAIQLTSKVIALAIQYSNFQLPLPRFRCFVLLKVLW